jgi:4,5-dihydroxyphthalate decarboxylase
MSRLQLSLVIGSADWFKPILNGLVQPPGIDLIPSLIPLSDQLFWRIAKFNDFDVAELPLTAYLWGRQHGKAWTAIPVFPAWVFSTHTETLVNINAGVQSPRDLKGKRIGVPEYPVAAITWFRYALESEYGVRPQDVIWLEERTLLSSHYRLMGYQPPQDVRVQTIPEEQRLCDMLIDGTIDAVTRYFGRAANEDSPLPGDRSHVPIHELAQHPRIKWLFPDRKAAAIEYHKKIGYLQPIHCIIVKQEIVERHPWVPLNLYRAFLESVKTTVEADYVRPLSFPLSRDEQIGIIGPDFLPIGLKRNRQALEHFVTLAVREGWVMGGRSIKLQDLFHESTIYT